MPYVLLQLRYLFVYASRKNRVEGMLLELSHFVSASIEGCREGSKASQ